MRKAMIALTGFAMTLPAYAQIAYSNSDFGFALNAPRPEQLCAVSPSQQNEALTLMVSESGNCSGQWLPPDGYAVLVTSVATPAKKTINAARPACGTNDAVASSTKIAGLATVFCIANDGASGRHITYVAQRSERDKTKGAITYIVEIRCRRDQSICIPGDRARAVLGSISLIPISR